MAAARAPGRLARIHRTQGSRRRDHRSARDHKSVSGNLYLDPETAYAEAQALASAAGQPLPVGAKTLWKRLGEAGLLVSKDPDHQTLRITIWDARRRVLHLDAGRILGLGKDQGQSKPQPSTEEDRAGPVIGLDRSRSA